MYQLTTTFREGKITVLAAPEFDLPAIRYQIAFGLGGANLIGNVAFAPLFNGFRPEAWHASEPRITISASVSLKRYTAVDWSGDLGKMTSHPEEFSFSLGVDSDDISVAFEVVSQELSARFMPKEPEAEPAPI